MGLMFGPVSRQCSRSCDGGHRAREVRCLSDSAAPSDLCDPGLTPESREDCNKHPCVAEMSKSGSSTSSTVDAIVGVSSCPLLPPSLHRPRLQRPVS